MSIQEASNVVCLQNYRILNEMPHPSYGNYLKRLIYKLDELGFKGIDRELEKNVKRNISILNILKKQLDVGTITINEPEYEKIGNLVSLVIDLARNNLENKVRNNFLNGFISNSKIQMLNTFNYGERLNIYQFLSNIYSIVKNKYNSKEYFSFFLHTYDLNNETFEVTPQTKSLNLVKKASIIIEPSDKKDRHTVYSDIKSFCTDIHNCTEEFIDRMESTPYPLGIGLISSSDYKKNDRCGISNKKLLSATIPNSWKKAA